MTRSLLLNKKNIYNNPSFIWIIFFELSNDQIWETLLQLGNSPKGREK